MQYVQLMIMKKLKLNETDKSFLKDVRLAIFANPFSDERAEVDRRITGTLPSLTEEKLLENIIMVFEKRLRKIFQGRDQTIENFQGEDRRLVQHGVLFHIFHKYCSDFDNHIKDQVQAGTVPCKVEFSEKVLADMISAGLSRNDAVRYFSLFFQMRRAFYFIEKIVGNSTCMKTLRRNLWNNIFTHDIGLYDQHLWNRMEDFSTMLLGATGTGKGLASAAIGRSGYIPFVDKKGCFQESFTRAFVPINLSQFPEQLLESELFGHKKGSFTGAVESHDGVFTLCSPAGAIFLDEIGEVSIPVQIKLLNVLQEREFSPVGSHQKKRFYGRVIAATNRSIDELRIKGGFRDDFYYRLCSDIIHVPSLYQRIQEDPNELDELLAHTLRRIIGKTSPELVLTTIKIINQQVPPDYPWPGNVRELEQCVRRILLKRQYEGDRMNSTGGEYDALEASLKRGNLTAHELMSRYCKVLYKKLGTYEAVARQIDLDRRTVKKYVLSDVKGLNVRRTD